MALNSCSKDQASVPAILVDNIGYDTVANKIAVVTSIDADSFKVIDQQTGKIAYNSEISGLAEFDPNSGDYIRTIDFTDLQNSGNYIISLNDSSGLSHTFKIIEDPYKDAALTVLKSFYLSRCGTTIISEEWSHSVCHLKKAQHYGKSTSESDVTGGWHDAGDYNKFSVTHNISLAFLLHQYLDNSDKYFDGQLNIPEAGNTIPDILDEAQWGINWLLKMQHANGGIHHKVSIKKWTGEHLPQYEKDPQYLFEISSTATAGSAAIFALGARVFEEFDAQYAAQLHQAAISAWEFLTDNPVTIPLGGFINPPDVSGGEYGDNNDKDERLWASVELFKLTGDLQYLEYFHSNYKDFWNSSFFALTWKDVRNLSYYSYLGLDADTRGIDQNIHQELFQLLANYANKLMDQVNNNGYKYALRKEEFYWGSNSVAAGYAFDLIQAYKFSSDPAYKEAALDQLHYLLGRNPLGISFMTGLGSKSVQNPYHQFSKLNSSQTTKPVPGLLVGGANYYSHLNNKPISEFTAKNYEDRFQNYMVNEPAINYTASFSYVLGYFSELEQNQYKGTQ